jgi:hypothetical protein
MKHALQGCLRSGQHTHVDEAKDAELAAEDDIRVDTMGGRAHRPGADWTARGRDDGRLELTCQGDRVMPIREEDFVTQHGTEAASQDVSDEWQASDNAQYRAVESLLEADTVSRQTEELRHQVDGLRQALTTHPLIDTARGIVMATGSCSEEEAWQVLVDVSQSTNIKLREIARRIVDGITGPPPPRPIRTAFQAALDRMRANRRA